MDPDRKNRKHGNDGRKSKAESYTSHASHNSHSILPPRGDYKTLLTYQKAEVIYDITFRFVHKHLSSADRTRIQMVQSARSCKQNILEGSKAGLTSKETEIKLTSVARASLEELLADYRDYLRVRDHEVWEKDSKKAAFVRELGKQKPQNFELYREFLETRPADIVANIAICLIHQTNYLLDQQLRSLEKNFVEHGGLRERMTQARIQHRKKPGK
jgi:four helix bundle suffix protein